MGDLVGPQLAKAYQPRSVLWAGFAVSIAVAAIVIATIWFASH